jgi:hypothetical protein
MIDDSHPSEVGFPYEKKNDPQIGQIGQIQESSSKSAKSA